MKLRDKVVLITGGGTGIGRAAAGLMAAEGAKVVIIGRREELLRESAAQHENIHYMVADVLKSADISRVLTDIEKDFGKLDVVINNAGIALVTAIEKIDLADYDKTFALNVRAIIDLVSQAIPYLKNTRGNVVNITSGLVTNPMPMNCVYTTSKAAVLALTKTWARELSPYGIRVNSVAAGATQTSLYDNTGLTAEEISIYESAVEEHIPAGRPAAPKEIASVIAFIASDDAQYVTRADWHVDGGFGI